MFLTVMGLILWAFTFVTILSLRSSAEHFVAKRTPAVKTALVAEAGIQRSLAGLRGWVALGDEKFKRERGQAWSSEIRPAIEQLNKLAIDSMGADQYQKLDRLLADLNESQWWVEEAAWAAGNEQAQVVFTQKIEPVSKVIKASINEMIEYSFTDDANHSENIYLREMTSFRAANSSGEDLLWQFVVRGEGWMELAFLKHLASSKEALVNLRKKSSGLDEELRSQLVLLEKELPWYEAFAKEAIALRKRSDWNTAQYLMKSETVPYSDEVIDILNKVRQNQIRLMHDEATNVRKQSKRAIAIALGLMIVMAIASVFMSHFRAKQITRPLVRLKEATANLAAGSLNEDLPITTNDELGSLTKSFNQMRVSLLESEQALLASYDSLAKEHERAESLLLNILPQSIAERLKNENGLIADSFPDATILFADIVGFTEISSKVSPEKLVGMLNDVFSKFDTLAERYGLEKIKTIGDAYMIVAGLPTPHSDHPQSVADMALDMVEEIAALSDESSLKLGIRIGIHSGPVVAGVIGLKKFIYDIWGDAVNLASRMESHGIEGKIQVSEEFYNRTKNSYIFEERGAILIKGKGELRTYFLKSRNKA